MATPFLKDGKIVYNRADDTAEKIRSVSGKENVTAGDFAG